VPRQSRRDEIGSIARALENLRQAVGEAYRLRQMVEVQPAHVMLCDPHDLRITYANHAAREILARMADVLQCSPEDVVGRKVTDFHKKPDMVADLLSTPDRLPYTGKFRMGPVTIENTVSPIFDRQGRYLGPMLNWDDVSEYVQLADDFEKDVKRVAEVVQDASQQLVGSAQAMTGAAATVRERSATAADDVR